MVEESVIFKYPLLLELLKSCHSVKMNYQSAYDWMPVYYSFPKNCAMADSVSSSQIELCTAFRN